MILTTANLKGGSGRTTTSLMLALVTSERGAKTQVVDTAPPRRRKINSRFRSRKRCSTPVLSQLHSDLRAQCREELAN